MSITVPLYGFGGGGGAALDLKIDSGLARPANPTPNMIWAKTDKDITGYALSAEKPENPTEGLLWLGISDSSKIKATVPVGKEYITLYFSTCAIYTSGTWADVPVMSYQNGAWSDWIRWLYSRGNQYTNITGGWIIRTNSNGVATFNNDGVAFGYTDYSNTQSLTITKNKIDVTNLSSLSALVDVTEWDKFPQDLAIGLYESNTGWDVNATTYAGVMGTGNDQVIELDISNYTGSYYIGFKAAGSKGTLREVKAM